MKASETVGPDAAAQPSLRLRCLHQSMLSMGSLEPAKDFAAVVAVDSTLHILAEEAYRLLMEPIFRFREKGAEVAVTVFRPLRDMHASDVYNWMLHFRCLDIDYDEFDDVAYVLDPEKHDYWRLYDSTMRGTRLFLTPNKDQMFQEGCAGDSPLVLEYVTIPKSLLPSDVIRTGYASQMVRTTDLVIAWGFPEDPARPWHR